jgi:hypothetical protein
LPHPRRTAAAALAIDSQRERFGRGASENPLAALAPDRRSRAYHRLAARARPLRARRTQFAGDELAVVAESRPIPTAPNGRL